MTFKAKLNSPKPTPKAAAPAPTTDLPDVGHLLNDKGTIDRSVFLEWADHHVEAEWNERDLADLKRWYDRHTAATREEAASRAAAIERVVEDLIGAYPGTRVSVAAYARVALEDWRDHSADVICAVSRTMRRTLKALPSSAAVLAQLQERSGQLLSAYYCLTSSRDHFRLLVAKGAEKADEICRLAQTSGADLTPDDLQCAHRLMILVPIGAPLDTHKRQNLATWTRLIERLSGAESWAVEWVLAAASLKRTEYPEAGTADAMTDDDWRAHCQAFEDQRAALIAELTTATNAHNPPKGSQ